MTAGAATGLRQGKFRHDPATRTHSPSRARSANTAFQTHSVRRGKQGGEGSRGSATQGGPGRPRARFNRRRIWRSSSKPRRAVVVPGADGNPSDINALQDDLAVMYKILEKAVSPEQRRNSAMGIWVFPGRTEHSNMYVDGYGAIFFLNASYPLAAASSESDSDHPQAPANEWEQTKREMTEPQISEFSYEVGPPGRTEEFKQEKVDELKTRVIYALTNATHIKELKADEYVTVIVTGSSGVTAKKGQFKTTGRVQSKTGSPGKQPEENQLVFRVKRRDLEAFEAGKLTLDAFRQNVMVTML